MLFNTKTKDYIIRKEKLILLFILVLSLIIRIYSISYGYGSNHFAKIDEVEAYEFGLNLYYYSHPRFFTYIPGPWQNFIVFALLKITGTIASLYYFMAFLGVLTTFLIYRLSLTFWGRSDRGVITGLISALFFAVMPWPVKFSNSFWNPYFFIPLVTLFLDFLYKWLILNKPRASAGVIITCALMPFFHMLILYGIPAAGLLLIVRLVKPGWLGLRDMEKKSTSGGPDKNVFPALKWSIPAILLGLVIGLSFYIPFLIKDYQNGWFILGSYFSPHAKMFVFRPEGLKMFSNIFIVMTNEISRFTGHTFSQYKNFLNRSYGSYIIGFIVLIPSFLVVLYSYLTFFKKRINSSPHLFIIYWIILTALFHFLSTAVHELRYTIIWFPLLIVVIGNTITDGLFLKEENKDGGKSFFSNPLTVRIILIFFVFNLIAGIYINFQHYRQERYPDVGNKVQLIPSLIFYEQVKKIIYYDAVYDVMIQKKQQIRKDDNPFSPERIGKEILFTAGTDDLYFYSFSDVPRSKQKASFLNLFYSKDEKIYNIKEEAGKLISSPLLPKYYISSEYLFNSWDKNRQKQIINLIIRYVNINSGLVTKKQTSADYILYFVDKKYFAANYAEFEGMRIIGAFPQYYLIKKVNQ